MTDPRQAQQLDRVRALMESGDIRTWADGFGVWHASVRSTHAHPMGVAKLAIRIELQDRARRDEYVPTPRLVKVQENDGRTEYKEA